MEDFYEFVLDENGKNFMQEKDIVAVQNKRTLKIIYTTVTNELYQDMLKLNGIGIDYSLIPNNIIDDTHNIQTSSEILTVSAVSPQTNKTPVTWYHNAILALIGIYKEKYPLLNASSIRHTKIWSDIETYMKNNNHQFNAHQCKWKFGELKRQYNNVKTSAGPNNTGGTLTKFKYFDEMDDIFRTSHANSLPLPCANLPISQPSSTDTDSDVSVSKTAKRRRLTIGDSIAIATERLSNERNERHKEKMEFSKRQFEAQEKARAEHKDLMLQLIQKL